MGATSFSDGVGTGVVRADGFSGPPAAGANPNAAPPPAPFTSGQTLDTTDGLTAHAGGGKASALLLPSSNNRLSVVATAADSVLLPPSVVGRTIRIYNGGANAAQVFGNGTDTINGVATATGVSVTAAHTAELTCYTAGAWWGPLALA